MAKGDKRDLRKVEFARRLGKLMADRGWNQSDLARAAQMHLPKGDEFRRDSVHVYLNQAALPRPKHLNALAKALGVTTEDLLPGGSYTAEVPPVSMQEVMGEPGQAWLHVDKKSNDADGFGCTGVAGRNTMTLITTGKAAKMAGVTRETIQNYISKGVLRATQTPGGHWRLDEQHVRDRLCNPKRLKDLLD